MCTNENSARLNNPMKQKKKQQQKTSNTCTLSVYTDLDELRLWSVVFIIHLVGASERGKKSFFQTSFVSETSKQHTGQCIYLHQATSMDDQKKTIKNIMPTTKKSIFTCSANL